MISTEFYFLTVFILLIFLINLIQILYLILYKINQQKRFYHSILFNYSFASLITCIWIIPLFYFRFVWSIDSNAWRFWSYLYHIVDAVQLYSFLLLITHFNTIDQNLQRSLLLLSWLTPIITYSPILWLSSSNIFDYFPHRRLSTNIPWWIFPIVYSCMYLVPLCLSFVLISLTSMYSWLENYRMSSSQKQLNEHRENMAELTDLIETVLSFEFDSSSSSSSTRKSTDQLNSSMLFFLSCLFSILHLPYVISSLLDIYTSYQIVFIYLHWFGTMILPLIHIKRNSIRILSMRTLTGVLFGKIGIKL